MPSSTAVAAISPSTTPVRTEEGPFQKVRWEGTVVTWPLHGATYDITTGNVLGPPAPEGVVSYKVQVDGNDIKVELP